MKKIKLFVDAHVFDGEYQGTRTFIHGLYRALGNIENTITIYLCSSKPEILEQEFDGISDIHFLKYQTHNRYARLGYEIPRIIHKYQFDYAHFQYIVPLIQNCKYIVTTHDLLFNEFSDKFPLTYRLKNNFLFKRSVALADILTTVSTYSKQSIHRFYQVPLQDIHLIPNGISEVFFETYDTDRARAYIRQKYGLANYLLYVSRIEPRKNHALLLQAYLNLRLWEANISLVFIGKTSLESQKLNILLEQLAPEQRRFIHVLEDIRHDELLLFYQACRLFVYPSEAEGFGIPPLEAAALAIPTLCSNTTAMADFDFFGSNLFDPGCLDELMNKIVFNLNHDFPKVRADIKKTIQNRYSWRGIAHQFADLVLKSTRTG